MFRRTARDVRLTGPAAVLGVNLANCVTKASGATPLGGFFSFCPVFTYRNQTAMLNSVDTFDVPTRVRELELSINRRVREALQPFIGDSATLEATSREILLISRDYAGSFQAITNRARIRREREAE